MNPFKDAQASLMKFLTDTMSAAVTINSDGGAAPALVDWDAQTDETTIPDGDLYGLMDYGIIDEGGQYTVSARICLSTRQDENLFRSRDFTNHLFNACLMDKQVPLLNAETGSRIGTMKFMEGTQVLPLVTTVVRSYRHIAVSLTYSVAQP